MTTETRTIPLAAGGPSPRHASSTVLVVGDVASVKTICDHVLSGTPAEARGVKTVGAALAEVCERPPLAIVTTESSVGLPTRSLIAALKASPRHRAIPIVLVTSNITEAEAAVGRHRPDRFLVIDSDLASDLSAFFDHTGMLGRDESIPEETKLSGRILFAEDATTVQKLVAAILHVAGAEVVTVANGLDAIVAASNETFDLILMDLEMPKMDGRVATKTLRTMGVETPILAFTAHDSMEFRQEASSLGFSGVIGKVLSRGPFVAALAAYISGGGK